MVDQGGTSLHVLENSYRVTQNHLLHVMRVPKHHEQVVSLLGDLFRLHELRASLDQLICLACSPVVDHERVALFHQVTCHAFPHDSGTYPSNLGNSTLNHLMLILLTFSY